MITLSEAADAAGISKSTLLRAIRSGRLSASKTDTGTFVVAPSELFRVYPAASPDARQSSSMTRHAPASEATDALVTQLRETIEAMRRDHAATIADLREDRDRWHAQAERLALPAPARSGSIFSRLFGRAA